MGKIGIINYIFLLCACFVITACNEVVLPKSCGYHGPVKSVMCEKTERIQFTYRDGTCNGEKQSYKYTAEYDKDGLLIEKTNNSYGGEYTRRTYEYSKEKKRTICYVTEYSNKTIHSKKIYNKDGNIILYIPDDDRPGNYVEYSYDALGRDIETLSYEHNDIVHKYTTEYNDEEGSEIYCEYSFEDDELRVTEKEITFYHNDKIAQFKHYSYKKGEGLRLYLTRTYSPDGTEYTEKTHLDCGTRDVDWYHITYAELDSHGNLTHSETRHSYNDMVEIFDAEYEYDYYGNMIYEEYDHLLPKSSSEYECHGTITYEFEYYSEVENSNGISVVGIIILIITGLTFLFGIIWEIKHPSINKKHENKKEIIIWAILIILGCLSFYFDYHHTANTTVGGYNNDLNSSFNVSFKGGNKTNPNGEDTSDNYIHKGTITLYQKSGRSCLFDLYVKSNTRYIGFGGLYYKISHDKVKIDNIEYKTHR